jgi:hypothetical protein
MGKEAEIISKCKKSIFMNFQLPIVVKISKDPPVLSQQSMNIAYKIICIAVKSVVVIIPALIRTELFIGTATDRLAAIETFLFHSTKVLIKIRKNVFKRIETIIIDFIPYISV